MAEQCSSRLRAAVRHDRCQACKLTFLPLATRHQARTRGESYGATHASLPNSVETRLFQFMWAVPWLPWLAQKAVALCYYHHSCGQPAVPRAADAAAQRRIFDSIDSICFAGLAHLGSVGHQLSRERRGLPHGPAAAAPPPRDLATMHRTVLSITCPPMFVLQVGVHALAAKPHQFLASVTDRPRCPACSFRPLSKMLRLFTSRRRGRMTSSARCRSLRTTIDTHLQEGTAAVATSCSVLCPFASRPRRRRRNGLDSLQVP